MPSWDAEREAALVDAVRRFGRHPQCWQTFARLPDLIVFTAQALRQRWSQLCQQHPPEQVYTHCSQDRVPLLGEPPAFREAAELTLVSYWSALKSPHISAVLGNIMCRRPILKAWFVLKAPSSSEDWPSFGILTCASTAERYCCATCPVPSKHLCAAGHPAMALAVPGAWRTFDPSPPLSVTPSGWLCTPAERATPSPPGAASPGSAALTLELAGS